MSLILDREIDLLIVRRYFMALLFCFIVLALCQVVRELYNPDWFAYLKIFEDGGWSDESKDIGFAFLISSFKARISNNYDLFRSCLAAYFAAYSFFLAKGKFISYGKNVNFTVILFLALFSCTVLRFTIQIREGVALTIMFTAFAALFSKEEYKSTLPFLFIGVMLFLATLVHVGVFVFFFLLVIAFLLQLVKNSIEIDSYSFLETVIGIFVTVLAILIPFLYSNTISESTIYLGSLDTFETTTLSTGKVVYWLIYGGFVFVLRKRMLDFLATNPFNDTANTYLWLIAKQLLKAVYILAFLFVLLRHPLLHTAALGRLLNLSVSVCLLILIFNVRSGFFVLLFSLFVMIDQFRTVIEGLKSINFL